MGTNYYARINICKCCGKPEEEIHIGKSSAGWTFTFHATEKIRSYKEWLKILSKKETEIYNEYDEKVYIKDFKRMVENKRTEKNNQARDYPEEGSYLDEEGNSMSLGGFS